MNRVENFNIQVGPQLYINAVCHLNQLVETGFCKPLAGVPFSSDELGFIESLRNFDLKGLEFIEFALLMGKENTLGTQECSSQDRLDIYSHLTRTMTHDAFLFQFLGGDLEPSKVRLLLKDLDGFRNHADSVLEKITNHLATTFNPSAPPYKELVESIQIKLAKTHPLQLCQEMMGKKFKRVHDFNRYCFVPVEGYNRHPMRIFDDQTQILIFAVEPIPSEWSSGELARILKTLGDSSRLEIIRLLAEKPWSGKELAAQLQLKTPTITHHLDQLRELGLIHEERVKNTKYVTLNHNTYRTLCRSIMNLIP